MNLQARGSRLDRGSPAATIDATSVRGCDPCSQASADMRMPHAAPRACEASHDLRATSEALREAGSGVPSHRHRDCRSPLQGPSTLHRSNSSAESFNCSREGPTAPYENSRTSSSRSRTGSSAPPESRVHGVTSTRMRPLVDCSVSSSRTTSYFSADLFVHELRENTATDDLRFARVRVDS
jgi:hypothetical protein